jgi:hypothetical protein
VWLDVDALRKRRRELPNDSREDAMSLDRCYLTVLHYPPDLTERQRTLALSHGLAVDDYTASMLQKLVPPAVVKTGAADAAAESLERLRELGIDAAAITRAEIERFAARTEAKRLLPAIGAPRPMYAIEPLRPRLATVSSLVMDDVAMIVFGRIKLIKVSVVVAEPNLSDGDTLLRNTFDAAADGPSVDPPKVVTSRAAVDAHSFVIDLYTRRGECVQIDSDKCGFDFLGDERGLSDRENAAKAVERFRGEATRAVLDVGFEDFRPPPDAVMEHMRGTSEGGSTRTNRPAFNFYSAWRVVVYALMRKRA